MAILNQTDGGRHIPHLLRFDKPIRTALKQTSRAMPKGHWRPRTPSVLNLHKTVNPALVHRSSVACCSLSSCKRFSELQRMRKTDSEPTRSGRHAKHCNPVAARS